jgi:hypothetical protein
MAIIVPSKKMTMSDVRSFKAAIGGFAASSDWVELFQSGGIPGDSLLPEEAQEQEDEEQEDSDA